MIISGKVFINEKTAEIGTRITAEINGEVVKDADVSEGGRYSLAVQGAPDDIIDIYVNDIEATSIQFDFGKVEKIDLEVKEKGASVNLLIAGIALLLPVIIFIIIRKIFKRK